MTSLTYRLSLIIEMAPSRHLPGFLSKILQTFVFNCCPKIILLTSYPNQLVKRHPDSMSLRRAMCYFQPITHKNYPVMKQRLQLFFTLIAFCFFIQNSLAQQGGNIIGPQTLCVGECGTYEVVLFSPNESIEVVTWGANTGTTVGSGNPITFCPQATAPGTVVLTAVVFATGPNGLAVTYDMELPLVITFGLTPTIVPTIATCPQDSSNQNACEKICAFGTAQYEVTGIPTGTPVTWSV